MGTLTENLTKLVDGALSIFLAGLLFGCALKRGHSLLGSVLAYMLNNLT